MNALTSPVGAEVSNLGRQPQRAIVLCLLVLTVAKIWVAAGLDLFGDEAFYWQCSQRPAIAYADHPPVTATAVRLGTEILGDSGLGVRLLFLLLGAIFPALVYSWARPLVGSRDAWWAAGVSLAIPAFAQLGLLAVPDAILLPLTALFLIGLERATAASSKSRIGPWLLAGFAGALGLMTHYRFILAPAAALLYLLASRAGRQHWRQPGLWWMVLLWAGGLLPSVIYNWRGDFAPIRYYLAGRHSSRVDAEAMLEHLAGQALLITPLLYAGLIVVLVRICRQARAGDDRAGDDRAGLAATFALTYLAFFFLASPFEDSGLTVVHWPLPGYVALLPYLPATLRRLSRRGRGWWTGVALAPTLGAVAIGLVLIELGSGRLHLGSVREPFVGASEVAQQARKHWLDVPQDGSGRRLLVADNYKLGAGLEFALHSQTDLYVLDHHKNHEHGRAPQLAVWGIDERGLRDRAGEDALLVVEVSQIRSGDYEAWLGHAGTFFDHLEFLDELRVPSPGKRRKFKIYKFFRGRVVATDG